MMKFALPLLALAALLAGAFSIYRSHPRRESTEPPSPPPVAPWTRAIAASGLVEPSSESIAIGTPLAGVVERVAVKPGQALRAGDPLFALDVRQPQAELSARKAAFTAATARERTAATNFADADDQYERAKKLRGAKTISEDELTRRKFARDAADARLGEARAEIAAAEALVRETETTIERSTVRAPIDADVLQVRIRPGEFAPAGQVAESLITLGRLRPLHVRVDVDEVEGWRVKPEAAAVACVRGNPRMKVPLTFVRFEPLIVPKKSLTGASTERVDTRVRQVIYAVGEGGAALSVGQQMDVFIEEVDSVPATRQPVPGFRSAPTVP
jgi:multidrug efflux pump subunit AcrA (membrane-fusion protein)